MALDRIFKDGIAISKTYWISIGVVVLGGASIAGYFVTSSHDDASNVEAVAAISSPLIRLEPLSTQPTMGANVLRRPAGSSDPIALAQALQAGLARADCYDGPTNGIWTSKSKDSMRRFSTAVNAQLPVEVPDQSLLALVESNQKAKCSAAQSAPVGAGVAPPALVSVELQKHMQTLAGATSVQPSSMSHTSGVDKYSDVTDERDVSTSDVIIPPIQTEPDREAAVPSNEGAIKPDGQAKSRSPAQPYNKGSQRQAKYRKPTTADDVSRSITKGVKSIKRTLASFFY